jgi:hypothetical protein
MLYLILINLLFISSLLFSQSPVIDKNKEAKKIYAEKWLKELTEKGIEVKGDSVYISRDYKRAINDNKYREFLYPKEYSWGGVSAFIKANALKPAFWYLINLYSKSKEDKEKVLTFVLTYDKLFQMDEILVATFYTYSFMNPESSVIIDRQPETTRPDILEQKLRNVKEMVTYIRQFKETKKK